MKKIKNIIISCSFLAALLGVMVSGMIIPDNDISLSERRPLAQLPAFSWNALVNKDKDGNRYFDNLEDYFLDQFVMRDGFRNLNTSTRRYLFMQKDIDNVFILKDKIFMMDYKLNEDAVSKSADIYLKVIERYFADKNANLYYTIVPDKNYYSASQNGYLSLDYDKMFSIMDDKLSDKFTFIDIRDELSEDDYYRTDLHWKQTEIIDVANKLLNSMGNKSDISIDDYEQVSFDDFKGSYFYRIPHNIEPDTLTYLTNDKLKNCKVFDFEKNAYVPMYADEKLGSVDTYDAFLWGPRSLMKIENPEGNGKELVIFRDSFGSSLAPLLVSDYSTVTIIDIRNTRINYRNIGRFVDFSENCDVLFMYNTGTLNVSDANSIIS